MTAVVKLVFGAAYDKSRLTEFAAVLDHAARRDIGLGELVALLDASEGGIKALVKAERTERRSMNPAAVPTPPRYSAQTALQSHQPVAVLDVATGSEDEFVVLLGCRTADGRLALLSPVAADAALVGRVMKAIDAR